MQYPSFLTGISRHWLAMALLVCLQPSGATASPYSSSPRDVGPVTLRELVQGQGGFVVRVSSNGCTDRSSFTVSKRKETASGSRIPHYVLTVVRTLPDECKAIVDDGAVISFDLSGNCGITGNYSYSIANPVVSASPFGRDRESFFSTIVNQAEGPGR